MQPIKQTVEQEMRGLMDTTGNARKRGRRRLKQHTGRYGDKRSIPEKQLTEWRECWQENTLPGHYLKNTEGKIDKENGNG